jgi:hypothetical protein
MVRRLSLGLVVAACLLAGLVTCGTAIPVPCPNCEKYIVCPEFGCPENAASMGDKLKFHEFKVCSPGPGSVQLLGFFNGNTDLQFTVSNDEIRGTDPGGNPVIGQALVGTVLKLTDQTEIYDVLISAVGQTPFWVGSGTPHDHAPAYTLVYQKGTTTSRPVEFRGPRDLCAGKEPLGHEELGHNMKKELALVFRGDRFDAKTKTVSPGDECTITVACAGSAPAKMHLIRHTEAGRVPGSYDTTQAERTTMLKAITDDICGTGVSFTRDGMNVYYAQRSWYPLLPGGVVRKLGTIESVWDENGAVCLDDPRRQNEVLSLKNAILRECQHKWPNGLPSCKAIVPDPATWTTSTPHYAITVNPG